MAVESKYLVSVYSGSSLMQVFRYLQYSNEIFAAAAAVVVGVEYVVVLRVVVTAEGSRQR